MDAHNGARGARCPYCNDTGERDSGGTTPWGEPIYLACDCKDAEVGRRWRENSSLEAWFPITAERLRELQDENEQLRKTRDALLSQLGGLPAGVATGGGAKNG